MRDQVVPGHNRWHPDIPAAATVKPGSSIRVECREWTDNQIGNNDSANDVRDVDQVARLRRLTSAITAHGSSSRARAVRRRRLVRRFTAADCCASEAS